MTTRWRLAAYLLLAVCAVSSASALEPADIPEPLRPWVSWVSEQYPDADCAYRHDAESVAGCAWPGRLELDLDESGGTFSQRWSVQAQRWVALPGSREHWPQEVRVDGEPALIADRDGVPSIRLDTGEYRVAGAFKWRQLPGLLAVPPATAILRLVVADSVVVNPVRNADGMLSLSRKDGGEAAESSRVDAAVFRRLIDERPFTVHTRLSLDVSGPAREIILPNPFLVDAEPLRLDGPMPIRLLADGTLQLQVRPGRHEYDLFSRLPGRVTTVRRGPVVEPLPDREVWSFDARRQLRDVRPEGLDPVDPRQTRMPADWRGLPAYLGGAGAVLQLVEATTAADASPDDQLTLERELWLDFDGGGFTARDRISGVVHSDRRLEISDPVSLGRVLLNGEPQFITRLDDRAAHGVEVRPGGLELIAESRMAAEQGSMPVSGWNRVLREADATLHLPPGWRLAAAGGARAEGSWAEQWSTLDMFMVLVLSAAVLRIWGLVPGLVAFLALALTWQSPGAPQFAWAPLVIAAALDGALKPGGLKRWVRAARIASIIGLVAIAAPYLVQTAGSVIFPQLERGGALFEPRLAGEAARSKMQTLPAMQMAAPEASSDAASSRLEMSAAVISEQQPLEIEPGIDTALIQTGPGVPGWRWNRYRLSWDGPVDAERSFRLHLLPPLVNRGLDLARFLLSLALIALLVARWRPRAAPAVTSTAMALVLTLPLAAFWSGGGRAMAADFPPPEMLAELGERLYPPPDCLPHCVALQSVLIAADDTELRVFFELTAQASVAAPLLETPASWSASSVELDGAPARILGIESGATILLNAGHQLVEISGPVGDAEEIELTFPLRPHRLAVESTAWNAAGMERAGGSDRQLRLYRSLAAREPGSAAVGNQASGGLITPYFEVTRTLILGLDARVVNEVRRLSDPLAPVSVDVPLIEGESPVTPVSVREGAVRATFAAGEELFRWESTLRPTNPLVLVAPNGENRMERWRLDADTRWHVRSEGVAPVLAGGDAGPVKEWRPWPGEILRLTLRKPEGVPGNTLTIDRSRLRLTLGAEQSRAELSASLRSSEGRIHTISLPDGAQIQSVRVDGAIEPFDPEAGEIAIPLRPGSREVAVQWLQQVGVDAMYRTPVVDLNAPSVNSTLVVEPGDARWLIWVHGPVLGPAVLYWGLLVFLLAFALGLSRLPRVPVRWWQWFLLGAGISHAGLWLALPLVAWFVLIGYRTRLDPANTSKWFFNGCQVAIAVLTPVMLWALVSAVEAGLLGAPEMQVAGNDSTAASLTWYQDRALSELPQAMVVSVPMIAYRLLMLAWSLWLAFTLFNWLRFGWRAFNEGGAWRRIAWRRRKRAAPDAAT